jgi:hypothetical protein
MGNIFSYIADSITNRGALDAVTAKDKESLEALAFQNAGFGNMPTYTPPEGNVIAQQFAQQTMNPLPRTMTTVPPEMGLGAPTQQLGPQTYQDPRALMREYYADLIDGKRARETARAQEQLSDPMFRFRDTMTDVARNTIGLPFHILSGGQAFNNDPSREAQSRHEARLEELDKLNGANSELYQGAKEQRFADLMNLENQRKVSETNRINAVGQNRLFKSNNPDFYTVESQAAAQRLAEQGAPLSEQRAALVTRDKYREVTDLNGRVALYNKETGEFVGYKFDFDDELRQKEIVETSQNFTKAQGVYHADRPRMQRTIRSFASKRDDIEREINAVLELLEGSTRAVDGVLQYVPGTDEKTIQGKLQMLVANIGFAEIQKMREQSKSGGALGQVTEKELAFLQAVLGRLSQFDKPQVLRENLGIVLESYNESVDALEYNLSEMDGLYGTSSTNRRIFNPNIAYDGNTAFEALLADPKPEDFPSNNADTQNGSLAEQPQPNTAATPLTPELQAELDDINAQIQELSTPTERP